jgi:hypothetical protein
VWFDWQYEPLVEPSGAMLYLGKCGRKVGHASPLYLNVRMMDFAEKNGYKLPENYVMMTTNLQRLRNDNLKLHVNHFFCPQVIFWQLAEARFLRKNSAIYEGCMPLTWVEMRRICVENASSGFIFKYRYQCLKKTDAFARYESEIKWLIVQISRGVPILEILQNGPKTEIRPIEKLKHVEPEKRKQRSFLMSGMIHHVIGLILFYEQN